MSRVTLTLSAALLTGAVFSSPAMAVDVYLFKGAGDFSFINKNMHFSRGLERIADQLNKEGIRAKVLGFGQTSTAMREIRRRKPKSVAFIGHSMGALASMSMASKMRREGIRVSYVGTLDIPGPVGSAGSNVEWAENYWSITPIYGLLTNTGSHPKAKNIHVFGTHTTMDDSRKVKNGVLTAIRKIHAAEGGGSRPDPVETIMVENTQPKATHPVLEKPPVKVAKVKRLPKIDEEIIQPTAENKQFALANTNSVGDINQRISQAHDTPLPGAEQIIDNASAQAPINLLATPVPSSNAAEPIEQASVETISTVSDKPFSASSQSEPKTTGSVFNGGRITSTGRRLVSRISGMLARNGKRHDRKRRSTPEIDR